MIPKTRRKFERYIKGLDRWYLISIFSDEKDYLILFYTDITKMKEEIEKFQSQILRGDHQVYNLKLYCYKDKLTGLYNKDFFDAELSRLDTNRQLPICIIIGDLNGLKLINDAFGHHVGDQALRKASQIMKQAFRKEDIIARVGGDEFIALLPKTTEKTAISIVKRMKNAFNEASIDFIKLSMSFGIATKENIDENIFDIMKKSEEKMYFNKLKESKAAKLSMIKYLKEKLEEITFETEQHYERLKNTSLMLAEKLGLSELEKEELKLLCEFHDIGKIGVPQDILQKKNLLNKDEWNQIKRHSEIGYHIVNAAKGTLAVDELILMHHERWDGKGYPGLLKNEEIPITVRIFAIADAYEAMVNDRPYKTRISHKEALAEIRNKAGSQFDPYIAKLFVDVMSKEEKIV